MSGAGAAERSAAVRHVQRANGQVGALAAMITARQPFAEVAQQLLAARGSLDSLLLRLIDLELDACVPASDARDEVDQLVRCALGRRAPIRGMRRGHHAADQPSLSVGGPARHEPTI